MMTGSFHCDEALALSMLRILPKYDNSVVVRSRDPAVLASCNLIVDVGAKYEPDNLLFDHHQREFTGTLDSFKTKLSSAGLVYKHFGKEIIAHVCQLNFDGQSVDTALVDALYLHLYKGFMEHIDAIDNGISVADAPLKYHVSSTLSNRVGHLNPAWNQPQSPELLNERFAMAIKLTSSEFLAELDSLLNIWWPARSIVQTSLANRRAVHPSGKIAVLNHFCPWKDHLFEIEGELGCPGEVLYVLYQDTSGSWRIQAVPKDPESFDSRKKLPSPWCGVRDQQLSDLIQVPGCIFVHAGGFIGGCKTYEGALALATKVSFYRPSINEFFYFIIVSIFTNSFILYIILIQAIEFQ